MAEASVLLAAAAPGALRLLLSAALRGSQDVPGGRPAALACSAAGLVLVGVFLGPRRSPPAARSGVRSTSHAAALLWGLALGAALLLVHLHGLADRQAAAEIGLLGPNVLALLLAVAAGAALLASSVSRVARGALGVGLIAGTVALLPGSAPEPAGEPPAGPHVLLVVLDTLRRDAVSAYGAVEQITPALDRLAELGVRFDDCVAPSNWTVPSHASLFTGASVSRHGADQFRRELRVRPGGEGSAELPTLAELLAARGWETGAFVCNMNVNAATGFDRGFEEWHELWRLRQGDHDLLSVLLGAGLGWGAYDKGGALATAGVVEWIEQRRNSRRPWLLFVNLLESHAPYDQAPAPHGRRFLREGEPDADVSALLADPLAHTYSAGVSPQALDPLWRSYLGAVRYQDELLGRMLAALEPNATGEGLFGRTLVVVTSDHGENFGWRGLLGHGQDLNDDLLRVPLILAGPGLPAGAVDARPVSLVDLLPSLLALTGSVPLPADGGRPGLVLAGPQQASPAQFAARPRLVERLPSFVTGPEQYERLVRSRTGAPGDPEWAWGRAGLYFGEHQYVEVDGPVPADLSPRLSRSVPGEPAADDGRQARVGSEAAAEYAALLRQLRQAFPAARFVQKPANEERLDADTESALRALGYAGVRSGPDDR